MYRAIIIDDEKPARDSFKALLKMNFPDFEIVGEADSVLTGVEVLSTIKSDVVFLDINLSDGSGFNILERLNKIDFQIVFVTAYNNFAVNAFRINALDYILKPLSIDDLKNAVEKIKKRITPLNKEEFNQIKENWWNTDNSNQKLAIRELDGVRYIKISDIIRCNSHSNYTEIYLINRERIMTTRTLKEYTSMLENYGFFRIHQSHLVNLKKIKKIIKKEGLYVEMETGDILELSRRKKDSLFELMAQIEI